MAATPEARFVQDALGGASSWWLGSTLRRVAGIEVPGAVLDGNRDLLVADIRLLWAHWFVESLGDPKRYLTGGANRPRIFADVLKAVRDRFASRGSDEQEEIASSVADIVLGMARGLEQTRGGRRRWPRPLKQELLDRAKDPPRCWLCGGVFPQAAVDRFESGRRDIEVKPLPYVDILKPRGVRNWELAIQVDHVYAFAQGGGEGDNLALACGWCNRWKSWYRWLYDADSSHVMPGQAGPLKGMDLPKPFWTVRLMGAVRQCEHDGCDRSADNSEVTVAPIGKGALNPLNLRVTCLDHDPYPQRFQPREAAAQAWGIEWPPPKEGGRPRR